MFIGQRCIDDDNEGQAYVALSRATSLEGLQVLGFDKSKVSFLWTSLPIAGGGGRIVADLRLRLVFFSGDGTRQSCPMEQDPRNDQLKLTLIPQRRPRFAHIDKHSPTCTSAIQIQKLGICPTTNAQPTTLGRIIHVH